MRPMLLRKLLVPLLHGELAGKKDTSASQPSKNEVKGSDSMARRTIDIHSLYKYVIYIYITARAFCCLYPMQGARLFQNLKKRHPNKRNNKYTNKGKKAYRLLVLHNLFDRMQQHGRQTHPALATH